MRRVVAKKNNREKMGKAWMSAKPVWLSATLNLHVPGKEEERNRRMGKGPRKWIVKSWARLRCQVQFLTVSHWSPVPSLMPGKLEEMERKREVALVTGELGKKERSNCLLHWQPMAIPASSPLNIKYTMHHFSLRPHRPIWVHMGNDHNNYTPSYLHIALSNNY